MNHLAAEGIDFAYHREPVLVGIDLTLQTGEMAALVGPNGAGKSTLLKILCGLLQPRNGQVWFAGRNLRQWPAVELARRLAVVPQSIHFQLPFTVGQFVLLARHPHRNWSPFEDGRDLAAAAAALRETNTAHLAERSVLELSGGERQRVILAAALAQEPDTLLLDEPTAALDLRYQVEIYALLRRLNVEKKLTIVIVTHDLNLAARYCPRLILLAQGKIAADGSPDKIIEARLIGGHYGVQVEVGRRADGRTPFLLPLEGSER